MAGLAAVTRGEQLRGISYAGVILWVNAYICRDWFHHPTAWTQTLHGYWAAIARLADGWLHPSWWPFWDFGIPFEFTSAPLVPALAAALAGLRHTSHLMAVESVSAIFYCAAPVALFVMAWLLTGAPGYSFFAALFYSLLAPAQILAPEGVFSWAGFLGPHRLMLQSLWDETPRAAALTFLLLFILLLARAVEARRPVYSVAAAVLLALSMLASPFAAISAAISVYSLVTARQPNRWRAIALVAILGSAMAARFLPPSLWFAMGAASAAHETWNFGVITTYAALAVGWLTLAHFLERWTKDWQLRFFALWAYAMSSGPLLAHWLDRRILPQPDRFRIEMEATVALLIVFAARPLLGRSPRLIQASMVIMIVLLSIPQLIHHRRLAKDVLYPADVTKTIEYRVAKRTASDLPGRRVMLPGSIAHWANAFTEIPQFSGSEGTLAYSQTQQRAMTSVYQGDAAESIALLKAYGVSEVVVSGPASREQWKPFSHPEKFDGILPVLWIEDGVTAFRIAQRSASLAHVVPETALGELDRYNAALDDPAIPEASFTWNNRNHAEIRAFIAPGQVISIQISYHPGWHATIDGRALGLHRDALGLMWLRPDRSGPAVVELNYDGGWELRLCRWIGIAGMLAAALLLVRR
jgi:hypothetical protein